MTRVALYGRTYLDAEVEIPIESLATGKGKVDVEVRAVLGGFPCNAARALAGRLPPEDIAIVTTISELDLPRLRASVPPGTRIEAATTPSLDWPPITVIVNPARECRLLRSGRAGDLGAASISHVPPAQLHVFGRVDPGLVAAVRAAAPDALLVWCAGASAPASIIDGCDIACVNTIEGRALVGSDTATTREVAIALAERGGAGCVRVVTGRGDAATVAATRGPGGVRCVESAPVPIPREQIRRVLRAGDVFAAHFVVDLVFDAAGQRRAALDPGAALARAQQETAAFMTAPP